MESLLRFHGLPLTEKYEPWSTEFEEGRALQDQEFLFCQQCSHGKLAYVIPPKELYGEGYRTKSAASSGASYILHRFREFVDGACRLEDFGAVLDIGANDGSLLSLFPAMRRIAIDPNAATTGENVCSFFEEAELPDCGDTRKLVLCSNTLEHVENVQRMFSKLAVYMTANDVAAFQFPCLDLLVEDSRFDQVHHQHIHYFSFHSVRILLAQYGFVGLRYHFDASHYGMLMVLFKKGRQNIDPPTQVSAYDLIRSYSVFKDNCHATNVRLQRTRATGYGAALMLPLFAWHIPALHGLPALWDEDESKHGLRYVNFNKLIEPVGAIRDKTFVVTAINTKLAGRAIIRKLFDGGARDVIVPLGSL